MILLKFRDMFLPRNVAAGSLASCYALVICFPHPPTPRDGGEIIRGISNIGEYLPRRTGTEKKRRAMVMSIFTHAKSIWRREK